MCARCTFVTLVSRRALGRGGTGRRETARLSAAWIRNYANSTAASACAGVCAGTKAQPTHPPAHHLPAPTLRAFFFFSRASRRSTTTRGAGFMPVAKQERKQAQVNGCGDGAGRGRRPRPPAGFVPAPRGRDALRVAGRDCPPRLALTFPSGGAACRGARTEGTARTQESKQASTTVLCANYKNRPIFCSSAAISSSSSGSCAPNDSHISCRHGKTQTHTGR